MSEQTDRYLVIGESGSGKSVMAAELVAELRAAGAAPLLVVVSADDASESPLARLCATREEVTAELAARPLDLRRFVLERGRAGVYLEVTAHGEARDEFLDRLGAAVLEVGACAFVVDEAHELVGRRAGAALLAVWTRGRKRGVTPVAITQSIKQRATTGVSPVVLNRSTVLVVFGFADPTGHEAAQVVDLIPQARDLLADLRTPHDGLAPEYLVRHAPTGRTLAVMRSGERELSAPRADGGAAV